MSVCACGAKLVRLAERRTSTCDDCAQTRLNDYQDLYERWQRLEQELADVGTFVCKLARENTRLEAELSDARSRKERAYNRGYMRGRRSAERQADAA